MAFRFFFSLLWLPGLFCTTLASTTSEYSINPELFPIPEQLKRNVNFWIAVFSQYSQKQAILHDTQDLNIIYEIIDFTQTSGDTVKSYRLMSGKINKLKGQYEKMLLRLAEIKPDEIEKLTPRELAIYHRFEGQQTAARFRLASGSIRSQYGLKEEFIGGLVRSGKYFEELKRIFQKHGLPEELTCLPHVESSFRYKIYSRVGAAGMWQFTQKTGHRFLNINDVIDERIDPFYATEAAARLLKNNFEELGTWPLAITAYNHGVNGMARAIKLINSADFDEVLNKYHSPSFRFASRNFYAEFLAAVHVRANAQTLFGDLALEKTVQFTYLPLQQSSDLRTIASKLELELSMLQDLNPGFNKPILEVEQKIPKDYQIRIPYDPEIDYIAKFMTQSAVDAPTPAAVLPQIANQSTPEKIQANRVRTDQARSFQTLKYLKAMQSDTILVEPDETLGHFAEWLELPATDLRRLNRIPSSREIYIGQRIQLSFKNVTPVLFYQRRLEYHQNIEDNFHELFAVKGVRIHQIRTGENIWELCNDFYEIPFWLLMKYNVHLNLTRLKPGDEVIFPLVISVSEKNRDSFLPGSDG
jgi:hypothetical protein